VTASKTGARPLRIAIEVEGIVDPRWAEWFVGLEVKLSPSATDARRTTLFVDLPDQSAITDLLARVIGLNLRVVSVASSAPGGSFEEDTHDRAD
jgi:hypothetical protein